MSRESYHVGGEFGQYTLLELLGRGGMGAVYRAMDNARSREVALKLLNPEIAHDDVYRERFSRESLAASRLTEPHVVPIHDWGEIDGTLFIDMRLILAENLRHSIAHRGAFDVEFAADVVTQVAQALDAAHRAGIVHRDVKPDNIMLTDQAFVYLVDFGIAYSGHLSHLTNADSVIGSLSYIAPELLDGQIPSVRSDVYALGCVLYECLTGQPPFTGATPTAIMAAHLSSERPSLRMLRDIGQIGDVRLDGVLARALARDPSDRFSSAGEFAATIRQVLNANQTAAAPIVVDFHGSSVDVQAQSAPTQYSAVPPMQGLPRNVVSSGNQIGENAEGRGIAVPLVVCATVILLGLIGGGIFLASRGQDSAQIGSQVSATAQEPTTSLTTSTVQSVLPPPAVDTAAIQRRFVRTCSSRVGTGNESTQCGWALNVGRLVDRDKPDLVIQGLVYSPAVASGQPGRDPNLFTTCHRQVGYYECTGGVRGYAFIIE